MMVMDAETAVQNTGTGHVALSNLECEQSSTLACPTWLYLPGHVKSVNEEMVLELP